MIHICGLRTLIYCLVFYMHMGNVQVYAKFIVIILFQELFLSNLGKGKEKQGSYTVHWIIMHVKLEWFSSNWHSNKIRGEVGI